MKFSIEELSKKAFSMSLQYRKVTYTMKSNGKELEIDFSEEKDDEDYVVFDKEKGVYKTNNINNTNDKTAKFILKKDDIDKLICKGNLQSSKGKALLDDINDFINGNDEGYNKKMYEKIFGKYKPKEIVDEVRDFNVKTKEYYQEKYGERTQEDCKMNEDNTDDTKQQVGE